MSSRFVPFLCWLVTLATLTGSTFWIEPRTAWRDVFTASSNSASDDPECPMTSVFALDSSADGATVLCCVRGEGAEVSPLLIWTDDRAMRRVPAANPLISRDLFWQADLFPDGESLLVAGPSSGIARVDLHSGEATLVRLADAPTAVTRLAIAPCGRKFAVGRGAEVLVCDAIDGSERMRLRSPSSSIADIAFSTDGLLIATARGSGEIQLWHDDSGDLQHVLRGHAGPVTCIRFSEQGRRLASVGLDGTFRLWDTVTAELLWSEPGDGYGLRGVAVSPDGRTAAVGGFAGIIRIYDLATCCERQTLDAHTKSITALRFVSSGRVLTSAGDDGMICYWDGDADFALMRAIKVGGPAR